MRHAAHKTQDGTHDRGPGSPVKVMIEDGTNADWNRHLHADLADRHELSEILGIPRVVSHGHFFQEAEAVTDAGSNPPETLPLRWYSQTPSRKVNHLRAFFHKGDNAKSAFQLTSNQPAPFGVIEIRIFPENTAICWKSAHLKSKSWLTGT
jgi:hypothetical protein